MNVFPNSTARKNTTNASIAVLALLGVLLTQTAEAQSTATKPSQNPLLVNPTGAKPNLMLSMDNSGSMAFPYHETYGITGDSNTPGGSRPFQWSAQRSADVNPIYYNPRVHYASRVDQSGAELVATDGIKFVSNQDSNSFRYYATYSGGEVISGNTMTADGSNTPGGVAGIHKTFGSRSWDYSLSYSRSIPKHVTYSSDAAAANNIFTWVGCTTVITSGTDQVGCSTGFVRDVVFGSGASITLPADHNREAQCPGGICSNAEEVRNIVTWYRYYSTRAEASVTAIGQALADKAFDNKLRVGYMTINRPGSGGVQRTNSVTPGQSGEDNTFSRGVRLLNQTGADTTNFYNWLYSFPVAGGTPLHNSIDRVANYYKRVNGVIENPYRTAPAAATSSTNPELSCRRSFNLLFSDGSWTAGDRTNPNQNNDNEQGTEFTRMDGTKFRYEAGGLGGTGSTPAAILARKMYTPYGGTGTGGLADLTAKYYWTQDFSSSLANNVPTDNDNGKPTFWQNMATYTVGYQVRPSGEVPGASSGLTFAQIDKLTNQYPLQGLLPALVPTWPTGEMSSQGDAKRIDDFLQAGFTGGGRGFSATNAEEVRKIFKVIISDVLGSSGADAGVAVSSSSSGATTIDGSLKYLVSFRTRNNSGDLTAYELNAKGGVKLDGDGKPLVRWSANNKMPTVANRNIFTISGTTSPEEFKGNFSSLSSDVKASLSIGDSSPTRIASNSGFVDYVRGNDGSVDANGKLFRQRAGTLGAMVNPPSVYMGGSSYIRYNNTSSTVTGKNDFAAYVTEKQAAPASVIVATNAGAAHVLKADTGVELAAFMPRRSLSYMLSNARDDYEFEYVLDGPLSENDIYEGGKWQHIAVGTGGRGEKLIYALRSPINKDASGAYDRQPTKDDFLWETGPTDLPSGSTEAATNELNGNNFSVGYMTNESQAGQTENGTWVVVVNSGHYNGETDGSKHGLLVLNPKNGKVIRRIRLPAAYSAGRGLSGITMIRNADLRIVGAYAGDANGNLWRFSLTGAKGTWKVTYGKPLYTTENNRPIYGNPAWQKHPTKGAIVVIATGMLLEDSDIGDTTKKESIYGIWDPTLLDGTEETGFATRATSKLLVQTVTPGVIATVGTDRNFFTTSGNSIDWTINEGWRLALGWKSTGERSLTGVMNLKKNVLISTTAIALASGSNLESCTATNSPTNYIYSLRALDGRLTPSFDTNNDGKPDLVSVMEVTSGGLSRGNALIRTDSIADALGEGIPAISGSKGEFPDEKCSSSGNNKAATIVGVAQDEFGVFSVCPSSNWSRTQYQLSQPPNKN